MHYWIREEIRTHGGREDQLSNVPMPTPVTFTISERSRCILKIDSGVIQPQLPHGILYFSEGGIGSHLKLHITPLMYCVSHLIVHEVNAII